MVNMTALCFLMNLSYPLVILHTYLGSLNKLIPGTFFHLTEFGKPHPMCSFCYTSACAVGLLFPLCPGALREFIFPEVCFRFKSLERCENVPSSSSFLAVLITVNEGNDLVGIK